MTSHVFYSQHDTDMISVPAIGLAFRVRASVDNAGTSLSSYETVNAPGTGSPLHRHPQTEIFYVLEGSYLVEVGGERFTANAGDVVTVPGGTPHRYANLTKGPARQLVHTAPALDAVAFYHDLADLMRTGSIDQTRLAPFCARWEVDFLGPGFEKAL